MSAKKNKQNRDDEKKLEEDLEYNPDHGCLTNGRILIFLLVIFILFLAGVGLFLYYSQKDTLDSPKMKEAKERWERQLKGRLGGLIGRARARYIDKHGKEPSSADPSSLTPETKAALLKWINGRGGDPSMFGR